jgi:hypothetical protein
LQAAEGADPVVDMDHEVTLLQLANVGGEGRRLRLQPAGRRDNPLKQVEVAEERQRHRRKADAFGQRPAHQHRRIAVTRQHAFLLHHFGLLPRRRGKAVGHSVLAQDFRHPLHLAGGGAGHQHRAAAPEPLPHLLNKGAHGATEARRGLRGKGDVVGAAYLQGQLLQVQPRRRREPGFERRPPDPEFPGRSADFPFLAGLAVLFFHLLPELRGLSPHTLGLVHQNHCARRQIKQAVSEALRQRQKELPSRKRRDLPLRLLPFTQLPQASDQLRRARRLHQRQERGFNHRRRRPLRGRVESPQLLYGVAEEFQPHRLPFRRENIHDAAAHRILPRHLHRLGPLVAHTLQIRNQLLLLDTLARMHGPT